MHIVRNGQRALLLLIDLHSSPCRDSPTALLLGNTVNLVYKDHHWDQKISVILIHRWSLYASSITWKVYTWGPNVMFISRWSLYTGGL